MWGMHGTDMKVAGTDDACWSIESAWSSTTPRSLTVSENYAACINSGH